MMFSRALILASAGDLPHKQNSLALIAIPIYCRLPARWGLQQTHPGLRAATRHGARDPFDSLFLLRQGEPGTSQYIIFNSFVFVVDSTL